MKNSRPDRDEWHLKGAAWLAEMGDCTRRKVGALIVGADKRFVGLGYNGGRPGGPSCLAGDCPRGRHYHFMCEQCQIEGYGYCHDEGTQQCACGNPWPCPDAVEPGSSYDTGPGTCTNSHAEMNAVDDAKTRGAGRIDGGVMYVSTEPCEGCIRHVRNNTGIEAIIWPGGAVALP